jgi:TonB family protein
MRSTSRRPMSACRIRSLAAIAIVSLPLLGRSAEPEQPLSLDMQATAEGIVVTVSSTKEPVGKDALPMKELGRCNVLLWLTADGYIRVVQVAKSTGRSRLDDACLRGIMGRKMPPSRDDKGPIDAWLVMSVIWQTRIPTEPLPPDRSNVPIASLDSHQSPPVKLVDYPKGALQRAEHGDVFLHVGVADSGRVLDVTISQSSGSSELDKAALEAIRAARFSPAFSDQKAVNSSTDVVVSWILPGSSAPAPSTEKP